MEIECEFDQFVEDFETGIVQQEYMDEYTYRDNFSGNDIEEAQKELLGMIKEHLHNNAPGEYAVCVDWAVRVVNLDQCFFPTGLTHLIVY